MIHEQIVAEHKRLENEIEILRNKIKTFPKGILTHKTCGKYTKWYIKNNNQRIYIKKKQRVLLEKLALKTYYVNKLEEYIHKKESIELYLVHEEQRISKADTMLNSDSCYQKLLEPYFKSFSDEIKEWIASPYESNPQYSEHLCHKSLSGHMLRSKSEVLIDLCLYQNKIPFRYECALHLGERVFYPDFMIRHPKTGELFYWEHFGMMDDLSYVDKVYSKLKVYSEYNLIPSINLIITYETKDNPLTIDLVEKIIHHYFL